LAAGVSGPSEAGTEQEEETNQKKLHSGKALDEIGEQGESWPGEQPNGYTQK
jgi:hypothetical protein